MNDTHYIPYFSRQNGRKFQAACGRYVETSTQAPRETAPTCPECLAYCEQRATEPEFTAEEMFGEPTNAPAVHAGDPNFSSTAGYEPRKGVR